MKCQNVKISSKRETTLKIFLWETNKQTKRVKIFMSVIFDLRDS